MSSSTHSPVRFSFTDSAVGLSTVIPTSPIPSINLAIESSSDLVTSTSSNNELPRILHTLNIIKKIRQLSVDVPDNQPKDNVLHALPIYLLSETFNTEVKDFFLELLVSDEREVLDIHRLKLSLEEKIIEDSINWDTFLLAYASALYESSSDQPIHSQLWIDLSKVYKDISVGCDVLDLVCMRYESPEFTTSDAYIDTVFSLIHSLHLDVLVQLFEYKLPSRLIATVGVVEHEEGTTLSMRTLAKRKLLLDELREIMKEELSDELGRLIEVYSTDGETDHSIVSAEADAKLIFMGTGSSDGTLVSCLTAKPILCSVCQKGNIEGDKNNRLNTSIALRYPAHYGMCTVLIDVGKTFHASAKKWFPKYNLRKIDGVILSHHHMDAIGGIDDLRDWTQNGIQNIVTIYCRENDFEKVGLMYPYLVGRSITRDTSHPWLVFCRITDRDPFIVHHKKFTPLLVEHGSVLSLGFKFGNVCYISDVSRIPSTTSKHLKDCDILILDASSEAGSRAHFSLEEALEVVSNNKPLRTYLTGITHKMEHEETNRYLKAFEEKNGLKVELSYDGLVVPIKL